MATCIIPIVPCASVRWKGSAAHGEGKEIDDLQVVSEVLIALYANFTGNIIACSALCGMT